MSEHEYRPPVEPTQEATNASQPVETTTLPEQKEEEKRHPTFREFVESRGIIVKGSNVPDFVNMQLLRAGMFPTPREDFRIVPDNMKPREVKSIMYPDRTYWQRFFPSGLESALIREYFRSIDASITMKGGDPTYVGGMPNDIVARIETADGQVEFRTAYASPEMESSEITLFTTKATNWERAELDLRDDYNHEMEWRKANNREVISFEDYKQWVLDRAAERDAEAFKSLEEKRQK